MGQVKFPEIAQRAAVDARWVSDAPGFVDAGDAHYTAPERFENAQKEWVRDVQEVQGARTIR